MALGGCYDCLKYLMFVFNFIFWLVGCALLAVGIWAKVDERSFADVITDESVVRILSVAAYIVIVIGAVVMVLGFLGCCGAIRESQCMLATFFVFLFIIFSTLLVVGIYLYINPGPASNKLKDDVTKKLSMDVSKYNQSADARNRLDALRDEFKCCGSVTNDMVQQYGEQGAKAFCGPYAKSEGCSVKAFEKAEGVMKKYFVVFIGVAFGVAAIMLLGMIFSMLLCCAIRETSI